jgi:ABC-2 type transport system permease protein
MTGTDPTPALGLWRLEWLRLTRTPQAVALLAVFVACGLIEPVLTRYERQLFGHLGNGVRVTGPPPTPADGLSGYVSEVTFVGLILVVLLAAAAFGFDARPGLATFLRTRITSTWQLVTPRFVAFAGAAALAYLLGTLAAWYETVLLIGSLPVAGLLGGVLCGVVYLTFAVAVTALAASLARGTLATAGVALVILLALPVLGTVHALADWLPSALVGAPGQLASGAHHLPYFLPALLVTAAAAAAALAGAARRLRAREV